MADILGNTRAVEERYRDPEGLPPRALQAMLENRLGPYTGPNPDMRFGHYGSAYGMYIPDMDRIGINRFLENFPVSMANTVAHEGQHRQYEKTMRGENPRLTQEQYNFLLRGGYFNPRTGRKEETFSPGMIGYTLGSFGKPYEDKRRVSPNELYTHETNKRGGPDPLLSGDYIQGDNGFLANFAGMEGMLSPNQKLEDVPLFKRQFPDKESQDYYYRVSFPMTNWLKESNYPTTKSGKFESQDRSAYPKQRVTNQGLLNKVLEVMGF